MAHPGGRPTKYRPAMCQIVESCMAEGMSKTELCGELDINFDTMLEWEKEHKEFSESIKKGLVLSQMWWEKQGRLALRDKDFSYTGWFMNVKNRFGRGRGTPEPWADKSEIDHGATPDLLAALRGEILQGGEGPDPGNKLSDDGRDK